MAGPVIVVDASALVDAVASDTDRGRWARRRLADEDRLLAPENVVAESAQAIRRLWRRGVLDTARAADALSDLRGLALVTFPATWLLGRAWELRHNLTVTDGLYVALAEATGAALVTCDRRIASVAGVGCRVVHP
ncbi:MAG: type II toxin-antitoxin system VapC family toxin [Kineosporiaceae bacterium]